MDVVFCPIGGGVDKPNVVGEEEMLVDRGKLGAVGEMFQRVFLSVAYAAYSSFLHPTGSWPAVQD